MFFQTVEKYFKSQNVGDENYDFAVELKHVKGQRSHQLNFVSKRQTRSRIWPLFKSSTTNRQS